MNIIILYKGLFADSFTLILVSVFAFLFLIVLYVFLNIFIRGIRRPGRIRKLAEKFGLNYVGSAESNVVDLRLLGLSLKAGIENYCKGNYRGREIEIFDLVHNDYRGPMTFRVLAETIIRVGNQVIWPKDYSNQIRDISKGVTKPEDIFAILDNYFDNSQNL